MLCTDTKKQKNTYTIVESIQTSLRSESEMTVSVEVPVSVQHLLRTKKTYLKHYYTVMSVQTVGVYLTRDANLVNFPIL